MVVTDNDIDRAIPAFGTPNRERLNTVLKALRTDISASSFPFETRTALALTRNLEPGQRALTGGFASLGDGGAAYYDIVASDPSEGGAVELGNGVWAKLSAGQSITVKMFGAVGDGVISASGVTGTDDTLAINEALSWWSGEEGRHLHFPNSTGAYIYDGTYTADLQWWHGNKISMQGRGVWFGTTNAIGWNFYGHDACEIELLLAGGGSTGNFSTEVPTGNGTEALVISRCRRANIRIISNNYEGRLFRATSQGSGATDRTWLAEIYIRHGDREGVEVESKRCGQPYWVTSGTSSQTGAFGRIDCRVEGQDYGPVHERLNDLVIPYTESGNHRIDGPKILGCKVVKMGTFYVGEVTAGENVPSLLIASNAGGRTSSNIVIDQLTGLRSGAAIRCENLEPSQNGLTIDKLNVLNCDHGVEWVSCRSKLTIKSASVLNAGNIVRIEGTCSDVYVQVDDVEGLTGDAIKLEDGAVVSRLVVDGTIRGGAAGFSLINLGNQNNDVEIRAELESNDVGQLINIGFAGDNKVRMIGGSVEGTSPVFNSPRRAEYIQGVRNLQTKSVGQATIANGTSQVVVNHGLAFTPTFRAVTGLNPETRDAYISVAGQTTMTISTLTAVSADRIIQWSAEAILASNDIDA